MDYDTEEQNRSFLLQIPQEILFYLFSFIDAEHLVNTVAHVCIYFKNLLSDEEYWKIRHFRQFPKHYPIVKASSFSWIEACGQREKCRNTWKSKDLNSNMIKLSKISGTATDAVHLTEENNLCLCGGRDRSITLWKLKDVTESNYETSNPAALKSEHFLQHEGWVWSISSYGNEFCSTSFDSTVKIWDIDALSEHRGMKLSIKTKTAVLCSAYLSRNVVVVGCFNKELLLIDIRIGEVVQALPFHKSAVLCVACSNNAIVSSGENGSLMIVDSRNGILMQEKKTESFCMSMDFHDQQIWTGSRNGMIGVYDAHDLTDIKLVEDFDYGYNGKITGLKFNSGAVYSGCTDGGLKIYEPSHDPELIANTQFSGCGGITDISVRGTTVACATSEGLVALWNP